MLKAGCPSFTYREREEGSGEKKGGERGEERRGPMRKLKKERKREGREGREGRNKRLVKYKLLRLAK